jgi:hypothetical protein
MAQPVQHAKNMRNAQAAATTTGVRLCASRALDSCISPTPHVDERTLDAWLFVVTCVAQQRLLLERAGADVARLGRVDAGLDSAWRAPHSPEARERAIERLRELARAEGGLALTALDVAEASREHEAYEFAL